MKIVDVGSGPPLVLVPGVQGRWEWMRPGVDVLSRRFRVITFSLCDEPTSEAACDDARGFSSYVDQVEDAMNAAGVEKANIGGLSYGGLIAAAFAARHPERTSSLILLSALPADWQIDARARFYLRAPRLLFPLFALQSLRMCREIRIAYDGVADGLAAMLRHGWNVITHPTSPARMARRVLLIDGLPLAQELTALHVPTLVVTGDDRLDRVVPAAATRRYLTLWPHAVSETLARTGHLGLITRPQDLSRTIERFLQAHDGVQQRRRVG